MKILYDRLEYIFTNDFERLLGMYLNCDEHDFNRNIAGHFRLVENADPAYLDHEPVLAFSIGGSTYKLAIGGTKSGQVYFDHLVVGKNPDEDIHLYDFLDKLFLEDPVVRAYLTESPSPVVCFTLPVMINERDIPFHPIKIAHIHGLFARDKTQMTEDMVFYNNIARYFSSRKLRRPLVYVQSDPVIAHIGGLSLIERKPGERTILLVCGTGMATADNNMQRVISRLPMMDFDEELYPRDITEGYVFESGCAGKGLYDVMARAIKLREQEEGSALAGAKAARYFKNLYDSGLVAHIWADSLDENYRHPRVEDIRAEIGGTAFEELAVIAEKLMDRVVGSLAATILVTAVKMNSREYVSPYYVLFEGSFALDPYIQPRMIERVRNALRTSDIFERHSVPTPVIDLSPRPYKKFALGANTNHALRAKVDITLIGTIVAAIAHDALNMRRS